jgi:hypothetical protein
MVEGSVPNATGRHPATDLATLVQHHDAPPGGRELVSGDEAGDARSNHDAGICICGVRHGFLVRGDPSFSR